MSKVLQVRLKDTHAQPSMLQRLADGSVITVTKEFQPVAPELVGHEMKQREDCFEYSEGDSASGSARREELEALTMKELREIGKGLGANIKDTKKAGLIDEILAAEIK